MNYIKYYYEDYTAPKINPKDIKYNNYNKKNIIPRIKSI